MSTHSNGVSAFSSSASSVSYKTAWVIEAKLRRAMVDPDRSKLEGLVEIDQTASRIRRWCGRPPRMITVAAAVEVVDRATGGPPQWTPNKRLLNTKPRRKLSAHLAALCL